MTSRAKPILIFGAGDVAQLAAYLFELDGARTVTGFVVDDDHLDGDTAFGRPLLPASTLLERFPPDDHDLFVAVGYRRINRLRAEKCSWARELGYRLPSYVSPRATFFPTLEHGDNCLIFEDNTIQPFVTLGNNVTLFGGNGIGHHSHIGDDVFMSGSRVAGGVHIGRGTFIGVNATLRDHITIGEHCVIGAGAIILHDAEDESVFPATSTPRHRLRSSQLRGI